MKTILDNNKKIDEYRKAHCCICLERDNYISMYQCHFCNDGIVCSYCYEGLESVKNNGIIICPLCRGSFYHTLRNNIIKDALISFGGIKINNKLYGRWFNYYYETDDYIEIYSKW